METALLWIVGVAIFLLVLTITVAVHEAAHMVVAKKLGVEVPQFFIGFGKKIWSKKWRGTEYGFRWIPLGGFVMLKDPKITDEDDPHRSLLSNVKPWKRVAIFAAGPLINIIIGLAMLFTFFQVTPYNQVTTNVAQVSVCGKSEVSCGAEAAGVKVGDKIVALNGKKVSNISEFAPIIDKNKTVDVTVVRDGKELTLPAVAVADNRIGITADTVEVHRTPGESVEVVGQMMKMSIEGVAAIPSKIPGVIGAILGTQERDLNSPGSVVSVGRVYGDVSATDKLNIEDKVQYMVLTAASLNLGIGLLNLLPISPLDGGKIVFALIDSVRARWLKIRKKEYSPTPYWFIKWATVIPAAAVIGLMGLFILADLIAPIKVI